jgi:hypothetical protein
VPVICWVASVLCAGRYRYQYVVLCALCFVCLCVCVFVCLCGVVCLKRCPHPQASKTSGCLYRMPGDLIASKQQLHGDRHRFLFTHDFNQTPSLACAFLPACLMRVCVCVCAQVQQPPDGGQHGGEDGECDCQVVCVCVCVCVCMYVCVCVCVEGGSC